MVVAGVHIGAGGKQALGQLDVVPVGCEQQSGRAVRSRSVNVHPLGEKREDCAAVLARGGGRKTGFVAGGRSHANGRDHKKKAREMTVRKVPNAHFLIIVPARTIPCERCGPSSGEERAA